MHTQAIIHPGIKLRHIRVFLDAAAAGTLSAVARSHGISQPAVSRTLAELETLLGNRLFERQGRRLSLTGPGSLFLRHANAGLRALDAGAMALRPNAGSEHLRIGVLPTAATSIVPRAALNLRAQFPALTLSVVTGPNTYLLQLLRAGQTELMIGRMPSSSEMADLAFEHLYDDEVVLAARAGHPLADRAVAEILRTSPVILPTRDAIIRRLVDDYVASLGLSGLQPAFETVSLAMGRALLRRSDAVWFISRGVIADEVERGELVLMPAAAKYLSGSVGLTRRQDSRPNPALDALVAIAKQVSSEPA